MKGPDRCVKDEWRGKCCCTCFWRWADYGHPWTNGCRVTEQRGYVCANPELWDDGEFKVMSDWSEHGLCEVWNGKDEIFLNIEWLKFSKPEVKENVVTRYAVQITLKDGEVRYESIGKGTSPDRQDAHLYTRLDLAETEAKQYKKQPQWYSDVVVIPVKVEWPEEK